MTLLADEPAPRDADARTRLLAALRGLETECVETHRPTTTLQAIRSAMVLIGTAGHPGARPPRGH